MCTAIRQVHTMGQKKTLTGPEKAQIVRLLSEGNTTNVVAKILQRDHRTIKKFVQNSDSGRKKKTEIKRRKISEKDLRRIKREVVKNPLATSATVFKNCGITGMSRSGRCKVLREIGQVRHATTRPPMNAGHREKRVKWARTYQKSDFSKVVWSDEMRVTLDGPDGWARGWIINGHEPPVRLRRQQGGGGLMVWAAIFKDQLIGPFKIPDGVKINSENYCQFLNDNFLKKWYNKKSTSMKKTIIFMHDNAPSHASKYTTSWLASKGFKGDRLMVWPPASPDLNPIENLWAMLKRKVYSQGHQYTSLTTLWDAVVAAAAEITPEEIKNLTTSVDRRLWSVIVKKGGYTGH